MCKTVERMAERMRKERGLPQGAPIVLGFVCDCEECRRNRLAKNTIKNRDYYVRKKSVLWHLIDIKEHEFDKDPTPALSEQIIKYQELLKFVNEQIQQFDDIIKADYDKRIEAKKKVLIINTNGITNVTCYNHKCNNNISLRCNAKEIFLGTKTQTYNKLQSYVPGIYGDKQICMTRKVTNGIKLNNYLTQDKIDNIKTTINCTFSCKHNKDGKCSLNSVKLGFDSKVGLLVICQNREKLTYAK